MALVSPYIVDAKYGRWQKVAITDNLEITFVHKLEQFLSNIYAAGMGITVFLWPLLLIWINHYKLWDEITYPPFHRWSLGMDK